MRRVTGGSFDFSVSLPRRDATIRVTAYAPGHARPERRSSPHVFGLPRSAAPRAVRAGRGTTALGADRPGARAVVPGDERGVYVEDLVTGRGARLERQARFPAASTLKVAIAVEALRAHAGKPEPGSYLDSLLRADADRLRQRRRQRDRGDLRRRQPGRRCSAGLGIVDTWMGGGYLHGDAGRCRRSRCGSRASRRSAAASTRPRATWRACSPDVHLAAGGRGPLIRALRRDFTAVGCALPALSARSRPRPRQARPLHRRRAVRAAAQGRLDLGRPPRRRARLLAGRRVRRRGDDLRRAASASSSDVLAGRVAQRP